MAKKRGPKSNYDQAYHDRLVESLSRGGLTDEEIAKNLAITRSTLSLWKANYPTFMDALRRGKDLFDTNNVENSLLTRAVGYDYEEDCVERQSNGTVKVRKIKKKMPPDVTAQIFWLKNRNPKRWRDKQELEHSGEIRTSGVLIVPGKMSKEEWEKSQNKT